MTNSYGVPAGKYMAATGAASCIDCVAGKYSTTAGNDAESDCVNCVAGKYSATAGNDAESDCVNCVAGKYSATAGKSLTCRDPHIMLTRP